MVRQTVIAAALAGMLLAGSGVATLAQQNGIVIENNGIDNVNSAAGADNVRISRAPGSSQSNNGGGTGNEERRTVREPKDRDRGSRKNGEAAAAPAEAAPAEGDLQDYSGDGYVDPAAAPQEIAEPVDAAAAPIKLPNTGSGLAGSIPWSALAAGAASMCGLAGLRRRQRS